jgi:hypothetical protein
MSNDKKLLLATQDDIWELKRYNSNQVDAKLKIAYRVGKEHATTPKTYDVFVAKEFFETARHIIRQTVPVTTDLDKDAAFYKWLLNPDS